MNENSTYLTYEQVKSACAEIVSCKDAMQAIFDDFKASMTVVGGEEVFVGDASTTLQTQFNTLSQRFVSYTNLIQEFSDLITRASEETHDTDVRMENTAQELSTVPTANSGNVQ